MSDLWTIKSDKFLNDKESIMRNGNVFQIANGYMGYRGTLDEFEAGQQVGITLAGIFDKVGDAWREPVNAPNGAYTGIKIDGIPVSALNTEIISHTQSLEMSNASFTRETVFSVKNKRLNIQSTKFLSAVNPNLLLVQYSFHCNKEAKITIQTGIDARIWDLNGPHIVNIKPEKLDEVILVSGTTNELKKEIAVAEICDFEGDDELILQKENTNFRLIHLSAEAGKTYSLCKYVAVVKEGDVLKEKVLNEAVQLSRLACSKGFDKILAEHNAVWKEKWNKCDVTIGGDDEAQLALRYSIFQLLMVAPVKGSANSIPARALSGQVYKGAIFWDTEMFMFPFFLYTSPAVAKELLQYRINTLDGARRKAKTEGVGYRGAFYAWESQETGDEACTYYNIGDPHTGRDLRTYFRDKQIHISGDVALAMWEYFKLTGDDKLLRNGGAEVILECARFYYSYAYFKKDKDRYELLDVVGPDEYHERVNNDVFTNMVAKATFKVVLETVNFLKTHHPEELEILLKRLKIESELELFQEARDKLYIPQPDEKTGVIEQFDGYFKLEDAPVEEVKKRVIHPNEYLGGGQGVAVPTQVIKQADVVMMLTLFKEHYGHEIKKLNWEYYEPRTEHGSSLSACAYALVAAEIGKTDWAYKYFMKTAKLDLEAKYKVYVGTIFMGGSHPAANGGAWMALIQGFAGLKADTNRISINPKLYKKWKSLEFNFYYKQNWFSIKISPDTVWVRPSELNDTVHKIIIAGKEMNCVPGVEIKENYRNAVLHENEFSNE